MTEWRMAVAAILVVMAATLGGCSHHQQSDEWTAVRAGIAKQYGVRNSCTAGVDACLRRHGSGWIVREIPSRGRSHRWAWMGETPGTPGVYYLADGAGTWGVAHSVAEVRRRHHYTSPRVWVIPYRKVVERASE